MGEVIRNTVDWGTLEDSATVQIAKILADEKILELSRLFGHVLPVDYTKPIRTMEAQDE